MYLALNLCFRTVTRYNRIYLCMLNLRRVAISFLILIFVFIKQSQAVLDRYNVGVGYSASNQLAISTDTPGEFEYSLYLRTADNTAKTTTVQYNGVGNLYRTITLSCASDESNATDNPQSGTCLSGGPFVRGAFVSGNNNRYGVVKRFTLFCGTVQIVGEQSTDNWSSSDFYNDAIKDFLDNGASSTWCPTAPSVTPTPTKSTTKKSAPTPRPTKKPIIKTPTPTEVPVQLGTIAETPTSTPVPIQNKVETPKNNNFSAILISIGAVIAASTLLVVGYIKIFGAKTVGIPTENSEEKLNEEILPTDPTLV